MKKNITLILVAICTSIFALSINISNGGADWCNISQHDLLSGFTVFSSPGFNHYTMIIEGAESRFDGNEFNEPAEAFAKLEFKYSNDEWISKIEKNVKNEIGFSTELSSSASNKKTKVSSVKKKKKKIIAEFKNRANWRVEVIKTENATSWTESLKLYVKRNTAGNPEGNIEDGQSYAEIPTTTFEGNPLIFLTGSGDIEDIDIQFQLTGISMDLPSADYTFGVEFKIIETP
ncbi:MAG: hypothetical protein HN334_06460 [Candidatus Cloacimonetes bacterium]|jgi:hypothetical protein|nr:hypothetical protein [Candidatus Cloacimonadota bacterium]MBT7468917.1 hypothetical protein [Candidatus Cloacimonadota bacterium]